MYLTFLQTIIRYEYFYWKYVRKVLKLRYREQGANEFPNILLLSLLMYFDGKNRVAKVMEIPEIFYYNGYRFLHKSE